MRGKIHSERFDFRGAYGVHDLIYIGRPVLTSARALAEKARAAHNAPVGS